MGFKKTKRVAFPAGAQTSIASSKTSKNKVKLLIVESPGKLATLRKILGSGWIFEASIGHTTELAHDGHKKLGFDLLTDQVITRYIPRADRGRRVLAQLRRAVKQADEVYLATDPDREGEAIAWHLVEQLRLKKYLRVSYTQITEAAVQTAIANPRKLDFPMVHAQRARQCLDKLVGYEVSPLLWNSSGGKSAGRVQSATLHLVCERERARLAFRPEDYWTLQAKYLSSHSATKQSISPDYFIANFVRLNQIDQNQIDKTQDQFTRISTGAEAEQIKRLALSTPHQVLEVVAKTELRSPLPPLITSSLQQVAGVRFKFSPQTTMKIAQELYEGIGGQGLITYMRTDAVQLSPEFVDEVRQWLSANSPESLPSYSKKFTSKNSAQAAHEAIRPTNVSVTPALAKDRLNRNQFQLYELIWSRAVASQCKNASLAKTRIVIEAATTRWVANGMQIKELGYLKFWKNTEDEIELPQLVAGQLLQLQAIKIEQKTTQAPPRYSEAKLVQLMEKSGIGRPSTYASTVLTLKDRDYVVIEKEALKPTDLGLNTDIVLTRTIPELVDIKFTAQMEKSLDEIADQKLEWQKFLCQWNGEFLQAAIGRARHALQQNPEFKMMGQAWKSKAAKAQGPFRTKTKRKL